MAHYDDFVDRGETHWVPYLMYTHRPSYRSPVVNTDRLGFRLTHGPGGRQASAASGRLDSPVNVLTGSSTAFGVGTTADEATIASRLWSRSPEGPAWLNFGVRGYNSSQEVLLFMLHRHLLPAVDRIVVFSGLNNLALAGLPRSVQGEYGPFFFSGEYFHQMEELREQHRKAKTKRGGLFRRSGATVEKPPPAEEAPVSLDERLGLAVDRTAKDLARWRLLAPEAEITFVLQPLATWVRPEPVAEEQRLFDALDRKSSAFWQLFGALAPPEVGRRYAAGLAQACAEQGVSFADLNPLLATAATPEQWLFVDRAHFTDSGYALVADVLADTIKSS